MMKFDFAIGNPPYQEEYNGSSNGANPVYNLFIDASREISKKGSFIHPARFLFNVGKTPKSWNKKMLSDQHFKILEYWKDSSVVFPNVDIKGGVVISCWDEDKDYGTIGVFTAYTELKNIIQKVLSSSGFCSLSEIVSPVGTYRLTDVLYKENPWAETRPSKGHKYDVTSNVFDVFPELFFEDNPKDGTEYIRILGRLNNKRCFKWIKKSYVKTYDNFGFYKVFITKANGSGTLGEPLSMPIIGKPNEGHTFTFLSIGKWNSEYEANAALKYLSTKFARIMLGTLKPTQDNLKETWRNVPIQDFSEESDIDWQDSIANIDFQLYKKYGLSAEEVDFIEGMAKEMA